MSDHHSCEPNPIKAPIYEIRVEGHLGRHWAPAFGGLTMAQEANGDTLITGPVVDQAQLHGILRRIRDSGMALVSVTRVQSS